jgi:hypothetical protein
MFLPAGVGTAILQNISFFQSSTSQFVSRGQPPKNLIKSRDFKLFFLRSGKKGSSQIHPPKILKSQSIQGISSIDLLKKPLRFKHPWPIEPKPLFCKGFLHIFENALTKNPIKMGSFHDASSYHSQNSGVFRMRG